MIPALIAAGLLLGGVALVANWDDIVDWVRDFVPRFKSAWQKISPHLPYEMQFLGDLIVKAGERLVSIMNKVYYQEESGQWVEETTKRNIPENQVPAHIRDKILRQKQQTGEAVEISQELALEMAG